MINNGYLYDDLPKSMPKVVLTVIFVVLYTVFIVDVMRVNLLANVGLLSIGIAFIIFYELRNQRKQKNNEILENKLPSFAFSLLNSLSASIFLIFVYSPLFPNKSSDSVPYGVSLFVTVVSLFVCSVTFNALIWKNEMHTIEENKK